MTANIADVLPAGTVTDAGTVATAKLLVRPTFNPPVGALAVSVTVPVAEMPPTTVAGFTPSDRTDGAFIVRVPAFEMPLKVAEIVASFCALTALVFTANVAELWPAATVTDAGTVATVTLLDTLTTKPPVGASPLKETVPTDELPPRTELGEKVTDDTVGGVMVRVTDFVCPPSVAVIVEVVCFATALVMTVNVAV